MRSGQLPMNRSPYSRTRLTEVAPREGLFSTDLRLIFCFLLFVAPNCFSQSSDSLQGRINKKRLTTVVMATGASYTASMIGLGNIWYSQSAHQSFRFFNDAKEWKQMDK